MRGVMHPRPNSKSVQGSGMNWLSPRVDEKPLVAVGSLGMCASFLLLQFETTPAVYAAALLFALGKTPAAAANLS